MLDVGELDLEVTIEQLAGEATRGYPTQTWEPLEHHVFMSRVDTRGRQRYESNQDASTFDTRWEMQWRDDMDPDAFDIPKVRRLVFEGRLYLIVAAIELGRQEGIALLTIAGTRMGESE